MPGQLHFASARVANFDVFGKAVNSSSSVSADSGRLQCLSPHSNFLLNGKDLNLFSYVTIHILQKCLATSPALAGERLFLYRWQVADFSSPVAGQAA